MKRNVIYLNNKDWWKEERVPSKSLTVKSRPRLSKKYHTPKQVAERLSCSLNLIYECIRSGRLAAQPLGRTYRISEESLEEFLDNEHRKKLG